MASETSAAATGTSGGWDVYFGRPAPPEGGVNWDAYSHDELYQMLWQDADVADVSTIAAEWSEHRAALVNHAEVLREQRAALVESWQGTGAEEAARRLGVLAERVEKIAELAHAGQQAAEQAADALARARASMPPPPGDASAPMTDPATNWAGLTSAPAGTPSAIPGASAFLPPRPETTASTAPSSAADPGAAFGAVGGAGFSFYVGANTTDLQKQQAVRSMQTYESSLTSSSQLIGQAQGTIPAAATMPRSATTPAAAGKPRGARSAAGGPSWHQLVRSGSSSGIAAPGPVSGAALGAVAGGVAAGMGAAAGPGATNPLGQGMRVGSMLPGGPGSPAALAAAETAAARSGAMGGMVPPGAGTRGKADDEDHENHLPTIDHRLFPMEEPGSEAVIGLGQGLGQEEHR
ncbi:hypothetical protein [Prauserella cavernicola]|uniref:PPE family domain-containing protein n=1 Tax=Prauserella cavernicola TaxID=2800127 RepID=A0A934QP51_9PSEU|nr:hypothetical protein [Prauserella cavernicola]MBK1783572.1 hypothetical protein [Prauserella cavernicola]